MTCKLLMIITFATVVRLRLTIYQNVQNWKENPYAIIGPSFLPKHASNCLKSAFKDQTPNFFQTFKTLCNCFFLYIMRSSQFFQDNRMFNQFYWSKFNKQLGNLFNRQLGNLTQTLNSSNKQNSSQTKFE